MAQRFAALRQISVQIASLGCLVLITADQLIVRSLRLSGSPWLSGSLENRFWPWNGNPAGLIAAAVFIMLLALLYRRNGPLLLLVGGWVGNVIQRLWYGEISDYLPFLWWRLNLPDILIILGLFWYAFVILMHEKTGR